MITIEKSLAAVEHAAVVFGPIPRGIYSLSGQDARRYLQGRVTQDIKALKILEAADTLLLTPQGRVLGQLLIANLGDTFFVISDPLPLPEQRSDLLRSLLLFKVADDVQSEDRSEQYAALTAVGPHVRALVTNVFGLSFDTPLPTPKLPLVVTADNVTVLHRPLGGFDAVDIIFPIAQLESLRSRLAAAEPSPMFGELSGFEAVRITAGIPQMGAEITEKVVGADLPLERTVAFRKGCYAGQEVIEMATARGRPNRRLVAIRIQAPAEFAPGCELFVEEEGQRRAVGSLTSTVFLAERGETRALAFIKNSVAEDAPLFVMSTQTGAAVTEAVAVTSCRPGC